MRKIYEEIEATSGFTRTETRQGAYKHRTGRPASVTFDNNGCTLTERWYQGGVTYRDTGPAVTSYRLDGSRQQEAWFFGAGGLSRKDGPTLITYWGGKVFPGDARSHEELIRDGAIRSETWFFDWEPHRKEGPAETQYYEDGSVESKKWVTEGQTLAEVLFFQGKVFPGDTRSYTELHRDGAVERATGMA